MDKLRLFLLLQLCVLAASQKTELDSPFNLLLYRRWRSWLLENFGLRNERALTSAEENRKIQKQLPPDVPFPCNVTGGRSSKVPDSVHRLRPGDIDVIAAMGDSLSAGNGIFATSIVQIGVESRGAVGSIGGQGNWRTFLTLPNILREFNPKLVGYAFGDSLTIDSDSQLNVAELGAMSKDMPFMARHLINKMKKDPRIDIKKDWKLVSIFIGCNDFCTELCAIPSPSSLLEQHRIDLVNTLRILRDNLPRTFVALVLPPNLKFEDRKEEYYDIMTRWQDVDAEVAEYPEFHKNDFTVEALPILRKTTIPRTKDGYTDLTYLSSDCFHIAQKGQARYANGLWNNLLEPSDNRSIFWHETYEKFLCPTPERPYLTTHENSPKSNDV